MVLNKTLYKYVLFIVILAHIPLFIMIEPFIVIGGSSQPIPVWIILIHSWLYIEARSKFIDMPVKVHVFGILTGFVGFFPGLMLHVIPNAFVVLYGLFFVRKLFKKGGFEHNRKEGVVSKLKSKVVGSVRNKVSERVRGGEESINDGRNRGNIEGNKEYIEPDSKVFKGNGFETNNATKYDVDFSQHGEEYESIEDSIYGNKNEVDKYRHFREESKSTTKQREDTEEYSRGYDKDYDDEEIELEDDDWD